jgi:hypothetical protein
MVAELDRHKAKAAAVAEGENALAAVRQDITVKERELAQRMAAHATEVATWQVTAYNPVGMTT